MAACVGWIAGTAWHLESQTLHSPQVYAIGFAAGLLALVAGGRVSAGRRRALVRPRAPAVWWMSPWAVPCCLRSLWVASLAGSLALNVCGWRAALQAGHRLSPELEGQDLILQGVVAQLPHLNSDGVRIQLTVERAWREADQAGNRASSPISPDFGMPTQVLLGWRSGGEGGGLPPVRAGDRWRLPVRLKAPHGQFNPHGVDFEGWLWSQGVMAVGQVRVTSASATQPRRLGQGVAHPVEQWRQACRDRLWQQGLDVRLAGVLSALLLGDQAAIDPLDWDVFRRTGVAHLMSNKCNKSQSF